MRGNGGCDLKGMSVAGTLRVAVILCRTEVLQRDFGEARKACTCTGTHLAKLPNL